jgi:tryptophan 2,3-dioxygenase
MERKELIEAIVAKYEAMGQNPDTHLSGLLHAEPITYWDYIQVDALLGLQTQRTQLPDEMVFIMYHQINELLFKMILWEIEQVSHDEAITADKFTKHLERISRYFDMLSNSFTIMGDGMDVDQYMKFRDTLTPASGFQSAQYRKVEFASTELINLIDYRFRKTIDRDTPYEYAMNNLYWQAAGVDHKTGKKNALLTNFEEKYTEEFISFMKEYNTINLWTKFKALPKEDQQNTKLVNAMRHYDHTVNVKWVMHHLNAAAKYLNSGSKAAEATGGSEWQKYMHPRYQRRIFFPELWSTEELENWGVTNIEDHETVDQVDSLPLFKA